MPNPPRVAERQTLQVQLLGTFRITVNGELIQETRWRRRKASALVKLLALAPDHRLHREQVLDLLWPDFAPTQAANSFHQALHLARRNLDPNDVSTTRWLRLEDEFLILAPDDPLWIDVQTFEEAALAARRSRDPALYRSALELYTGELLPDDRYEEWLGARRESLRQEYLDLLLALAEIYRAEREYDKAIEIFKRVLETEPAHEGAHYHLMELYGSTDRREQALKQYQALRQALHNELDANPTPSSERLYEQLLAGDLEALRHKFPPTQSVEDIPNNLPIPLTSFIGREREIADLKRSLKTTRLLTLTGAGGSGKTRLALQVAGGVMDAYPDGVWLVELAAIADPTFVPRAIAFALGIPEQPGQPIIETLKHTLALKELLVVLDNCEHLIQACSQIAAELLTHCRNLNILATSREAMRIAGEVVWLVPSLSLPDLRQHPPFERLVEYESLRLFVERAAAVQPGFTLTPENSTAVARICFRLDGIPLAIELAAARVKVLSVEQILTRLDDRFHLLTSGNRAALNRQQTLRATIDWGYELLSDPERTLLRRLAVFAGGCTLEAVESVCAGCEGESGATLELGQVFDLLSSLVDRSFIAVHQSGAEARYGMLETIREYTRQKLADAREARAIGQQHWSWCLDLVERANPWFWGHTHLEWVEQLEHEHENLRAALAWAQEYDVPAGLRLAQALWQFWILRGYLSEGDHAFAVLLRQVPERSAPRAQALTAAFQLKVRIGVNSDALRLAEESLAIYRELSDRGGASRTLLTDGVLRSVIGEYSSAKVSYESGLALAREIGDEQAIACATHFLGVNALSIAPPSQVNELMQASLELFEQLGDEPNISPLFLNLGWGNQYGENVRWWIVDEETAMLLRCTSAPAARGFAHLNLGTLARKTGDPGVAVQQFERALLQFQTIGDLAGVGLVMNHWGYLASAMRNYGAAHSHFDQSLAARRTIGERRGVGRTFCGMANLAILEGDFKRAHSLLADCFELFEQMGDKPGLAAAYNHLGNLALAEGDYATAESAHQKSVEFFKLFGKRASLALLNWAETAWRRGDISAARARVQESLTLSEEIGDRAARAAALERLNDLESGVKK